MTTNPPPVTPSVRRSRRRTVTVGVLGLAMLGLAACGSAAATEGNSDAGNAAGGIQPADESIDPGAHNPGLGMCAPGVTDCVDVVVDGPVDDITDGFPVDHARLDAAALIGLAEGEFGDLARVSRRGDEYFMLTEDYVLGRMTVELDDDGTGTYRVVAVTVELPDGPETITG